MGKRIALTTAAVFAAWGVLDFVMHSLILAPVYEATAGLWWPPR